MKKLVRLDSGSVEKIISAFQNAFSGEDQLWIFGSQTDLKAHGGRYRPLHRDQFKGS